MRTVVRGVRWWLHWLGLTQCCESVVLSLEPGWVEYLCGLCGCTWRERQPEPV